MSTPASVPASGWYVEVDHPSGHTHRPDVVGTPHRKPKVKDLPRLEIPVRRHEKWQHEDFDGASMRVWKDGERQPVDELYRVGIDERNTVLIGRGGLELKTRVQAEYDVEESHLAAKDLIQTHTSYVANVDTPASTVENNAEVDAGDTTSELQSRTLNPIAATAPVSFASGQLLLDQSCFFVEGENASSTGANVSTVTGSYSGGSAVELAGSSGTDVQIQFTPDYDIPDDEVDIRILMDVPSDHRAFEIDINGTTVDTVSRDALSSGYRWYNAAVSASEIGGNLDAGMTHTATIRTTSAGSNLVVDALAPHDTRFLYNWPTTLNADDALAGPQLHPDEWTVVFEDLETIRSVVGGRIEATFANSAEWLDDSSGGALAQALQVSNDGGDTWLPSDGSENQTTSVEADFADKTSRLRWRVTLTRYGDYQSQTPTTGHKGMKLDAFSLKADLDETPLVVNQSYDAHLIDILRDIADGADAIWEYRRDGDVGSIEWTHPGQRSSSKTPSTSSYESDRVSGEVYESVAVRGASQSVEGEQFTASHGTAISLSNERLQQARERVYDSGTGEEFERGRDYEMHYQNGKITTLAGGSMTDGSTYTIDYRFQTYGEYTIPGVENPREAPPEDIPALATNRACGQAARILAKELSEVQYETTVTIPTDETGWSVVDDIDIPEVPTGGKALHIRSVENTPGQTVLSLGTRREVSDVVSDINNRVGAVSRKV